MGTIRIKWQTVNSELGTYDTCQRELSNAIASVRSVKSNRCMTGKYYTTIYKSLDKVISDMEDEQTYIRNLRIGLEDVLKMYDMYESRIEGQIKGETLKEVNVAVNNGNSGSSQYDQTDNSKLLKNVLSLIGSVSNLRPTNSSNAEWQDNWLQGLLDNLKWESKDTWKVVGSGGIIGSAVSAIGNICTSGWSAKTGISTLKSVSSIVESIGGTLAKGADANWKEALLGLSNGLKGLDGLGFGDSFKSVLEQKLVKDLFPSSVKTVGDKVKVAAKWAGNVLTLATNAVSNYEEFGGITGRMLAETAIETVVDIGVGAAATALVSAAAATGLAALGVTVAAPAVVIGAGAAAVTWAANGVCKWITGGDGISETVSNLICDTVEAIPEVVGNVTKVVSEGVKSVSNAIGNGVQKVKEGFGSIAKWGSSIFSFA